MENPLQWVHGCDRLAIEQEYDVIVYHDENVVIKNPARVAVIGEVPAPDGLAAIAARISI